MKTPPLYLGLVILFWGWQTGQMVLAVAMALVTEASRVLNWKWNFSPTDANRIADLSALIFMAILIQRMVSEQSTDSLLALLQIIPLPFFPLLACQLYGVQGGVDTSALFYSSRQKRKKDPSLPRRSIDIGYPFALACVISASAANMRATFFWGLLALTAWTFWRVRSRRYGLKAWALLLVLTCLLGWGGGTGLKGLQHLVEQAIMHWYGQSADLEEDAYKTITNLGEVGRLKLSHKIVMRVLSAPGQEVPPYLRSAAYSTYFSGHWVARGRGFFPAAYDNAHDRWFYAKAPDHRKNLALSMFLRGGKGLLSVPNGAYEILGLQARSLEHNPYGAVSVDFGPDLAIFNVRYGKCTEQIIGPGHEDRHIPVQDASLIASQMSSLKASKLSDMEKVSAVHHYFVQRDFKYSLELEDAGDRNSPLAHFLLDSQKGHCEYYATATVLFLRELGIPARYATGYSVQEAGPGGQWVVRARHAHAWVLAFVDGEWINVDTTPSVWAEVDSQGESYFQGLYDGISWLWWRFVKWRMEESEDGKKLTDYLIWLLIPLTGFLAWRLFLKERVGAGKRSGRRGRALEHPGKDSEFYLIERRFAQWGFARRKGESLANWLGRLERDMPVDFDAKGLKTILHLHNQYRFDPRGLEKKDREELAALAKKWLESYPDLDGLIKERDHHDHI